MTEKRFEYHCGIDDKYYLLDNEGVGEENERITTDFASVYEPDTAETIIYVLNKLNDENERLRKEKEVDAKCYKTLLKEYDKLKEGNEELKKQSFKMFLRERDCHNDWKKLKEENGILKKEIEDLKESLSEINNCYKQSMESEYNLYKENRYLKEKNKSEMEIKDILEDNRRLESDIRRFKEIMGLFDISSFDELISILEQGCGV